MAASVDSTRETRSPKVELFAGYSYLPSPDSELSDPGQGFGVSFDVNFSRHVGLVVDFDRHSWATAPRIVGPYSEDAVHFALAYYAVGARYVVRMNRVAAFGLAAIEGQSSRRSAYSVLYRRDPSQPEILTTPGSSSSAWGFGLGGGVDIRLARRLALRAIQINYSLGGFGSGPGRELRLKTGVVFRFGQARGSREPRKALHRTAEALSTRW